MIQRKDTESADGDIAGHKHEINDTNPKHPLWPPSRVSQLVPKWFVHTGKSNLIEKYSEGKLNLNNGHYCVE